jgi:cysteine desulfurase
MTKKTVYLDNAAATPMDQSVIDASSVYLKEKFYNPSATYLGAKLVSQDLMRARESVAKNLSVRSAEITFTAGGTEANNLAIRGVMEKYPGANVIVSAVEHESVLEPAKLYKHKIAPVNNEASVILDKLEKLINEQTVLVSVMYANNEVGSIQPIHKIAMLIEKVKLERNKNGNKLPIYLHTDACQAPAYLSINAHKLGVDMMTLNGGKIYGPKQSGCLFISKDVNLLPQILGGGQEMGRRSGTENVANIIGFSKALELVQSSHKQNNQNLDELRHYFIGKLQKEIKAISFNGSTKHHLPNNVHVTLKGYDNETLLMQLDELDVICSSGSACNAQKNNESKTLLAMGLTKDEARSSLRFTMSKHTTKDDIDYAVKSLASLI